MRNARKLVAPLALAVTALVGAGVATHQTTAAASAAEPAAAGHAAQIPGLTAKDPFPAACVGCHVKTADKDMRLSTLLEAMRTQVSAPLLDTVRRSAPTGATLRGKHPAFGESLNNVPDGCAAKCHKEDSKLAPPLAPMVHVIHLTGGDKNEFLTKFGGQCTLCHKLDPKGEWSVPSGPEKK